MQLAVLERLRALRAMEAEGETFDWEGLAAWIREPRANPHTVRAYRNDLHAFFTFLRNAGQLALLKETPPALDDLLGFLDLPTETVNKWLQEYERAMQTEPAQRRAAKVKAGSHAPVTPLSAATTRRRLNTIHALLEWAHKQGIRTPDEQPVLTPRFSVSAETSPLDEATLKRLLGAPDLDSLRGKRDRALLHVLAATGLHRAQVCALDVGDFDREGERLRVPREKDVNQEDREEMRTQPQWLTLPAAGVRALDVYLNAFGHGADLGAPLFLSLDHRPQHRRQRLRPDALYKLVSGYGKAIGASAVISPRALRRTAAVRSPEGGAGSGQAAPKGGE